MKGEGNQQDYGMRIYDPRIGKFLSVDLLTNKYPELTPYQFASNSPIGGIDLDGEEIKIVTTVHGEKNDVLFSYVNFNGIENIPIKLIMEIHKCPTYDKEGKVKSYEVSDVIFKLLISPKAGYSLQVDKSKLHSPGSFNIDDAREGQKTVLALYGEEMAKGGEMLYRDETNHFRSWQYVNS